MLAFARTASQIWSEADAIAMKLARAQTLGECGAAGDRTMGRLTIVGVGIAFIGGLATAQTLNQTGREPQFENAEVKVWKSLVLPNSPLPFHRHEHPRVIVALQGGTMKILEDTGASETQQWQTGKAYWLPANAPGTLHQDVNLGEKPIEVMVIELEKAS